MKYLGFKNLIDMIDQRRRLASAARFSAVAPPLYYAALAVNEPVRAATAIGAATSDLHVQTLDPTNPDIIMYWILRLGRVGTVNGRPVDQSTWDRLIGRSDAAEAAVCDLADRIGFLAIPGIFAYDAGLQLIQGDPIRSGVVFDADAGTFRIGIDGAPDADPPAPDGIPAEAIDPEAARREADAFARYVDRGGTLSRADWWTRAMCARGAEAKANDAPWQSTDRDRLKAYRAELLLHPGEPLPPLASPEAPAPAPVESPGIDPGGFESTAGPA